LNTKKNWEKWHEERQRFQTRNPEGFTIDLKALEAHIKKLTEVCPKDKADRPVVTALFVLDDLTKDYNRFKSYLRLVEA